MNIFPKSPQFFTMFEKLASHAQRAGQLLVSTHTHAKERKRIARELSKLEERADALCHSLYYEAERTFITPIDREDIHRLAKHLDDVVDTIEEVAAKIYLFNAAARSPRHFASFGSLVIRATGEVASLISLLATRGRSATKIRTHIASIHSLEHEGDELTRTSMAALFHSRHTPTTILKWKDIYEGLERVLDCCEYVADTVDLVIAKNF